MKNIVTTEIKGVRFITGDENYKEPRFGLKNIKTITKPKPELIVPKNKKAVRLTESHCSTVVFLDKTLFERFKESWQKITRLVR